MANYFNCLMVLMIICSAIRAVPAAIYTVGEASGWSMGGDYSSWASDKTFAVGDTLVSANDYKTCTTGNAIASDSSGATSVTLKTAGSHYFICGIPGHCGGGMKLAVNVAAAASGGGTGDSSSTTATSPPSSTTTSSATPTEVRTPTAGTLTQPSSSATLSPFVAVAFTYFVVMLKCFHLL
ncbi:hypothetical protein BUALT_Bualt15G0125600 [Buddleja alternifolia]|uniref:Phytocyanin domain-containing protein n=1 Tax=Buddleja alternifolia TaxID=168488 RepID=A0AAV6WL98_9LAMI|nr:hypothetical protein BUALT_Bualt15G0125600 [Buddleja alternifolia]